MAGEYLNPTTYPSVTGGYGQSWSAPNRMQNLNAPSPNSLMCVLVSDENAVNMYPVAAGTSVILMNLHGNKFWIKSTNTSGIPEPVRAFNFSEVMTEQTQASNETNFVTKNEFNELKKMIEDLLK